MPLQRVKLNGVDYAIRGRIRRYSQEPFATVFRTVGVQQLQDVQTASRFLMRSPIYGFGRRRLTRIDDPRQVLQMWDSQVMTHYESQVSLPPLRVVDTGEQSVIRGSVRFNGSLWGLWVNTNDAGGAAAVNSRELTSATDTAWGGGGDVDNVLGDVKQGGFDLIVHKDRLVALWWERTRHHIAFSTDGATWTQATTDITINLLAGGPTGDGVLDGGLLATVGNELVAIVYDMNTGTIRFYSSTDSGITMVDEGSLISSSSGVKGVATYLGTAGLVKLLVGTENGVYEVDTSPSTWTAVPIVPMSYHVDNCRRMTIHQGAAWIPVGVNSGEPAGMVRYTISGDTRIVETSVGVNGEAIGLDAFDGVPSEKLGPFNWLKPMGLFLLAAVGGTAASRNGHLLIHNGKGWHYLARDETANEKLYWVDEIHGTPHYANRTGTGTGSSTTTDTLGIQNALVNPASGLAIARESSGLLDRPEFDGGMPADATVWVEVFYDAADLSSSTDGEYIAIAYGLEGATPSTVLGNILSGDKDLLFASGAGVSGVSIQIRETFNRDSGTTTHSPVGRAIQVKYLKVPAIAEAWGLVIDLLATARLTSNQNVQGVITNLETARDTVTLVPFIYGKMTSAHVRVQAPIEFQEELDQEGAYSNAVKDGLVQVLLRQIV